MSENPRAEQEPEAAKPEAGDAGPVADEVLAAVSGGEQNVVNISFN